MTVWLIVVASAIMHLFFAEPADANPPGEDESIHELVMHYIYLPCDALEYSIDFMNHEMVALDRAYEICISKQDLSPNPIITTDKWFGLRCVYVLQHWQLRYDHLMSVEKAWDLMCYEDGRKEKQYEIDF